MSDYLYPQNARKPLSLESITFLYFKILIEQSNDHFPFQAFQPKLCLSKVTHNYVFLPGN